MKNTLFWLRLSCIVGVIVDALAAMLLTFPSLNTFFSEATTTSTGGAAETSNPSAAALMWGWTVLLAWTARKPLERRGVLAMTLFPVLTWLIGGRLQHMFSEPASMAANLPFLALQLSIFALMAYSLWISRKALSSPAS